jgi:hypothetical protein
VLHCWMFEKQRHQGRVGHQCRAAGEPGQEGMDQRVAASENKPTSAMPVSHCVPVWNCGRGDGKQLVVMPPQILRSFRMAESARQKQLAL